ncbi:hypothetical protein [Thiomicrorhabdus indica]|uniref:hypothetical protein n=1 Tax=Thiomicrorhabdus indica TaxID=2267253 RepID=UPI00102D9EEE|nr:hypothetical protein [Thiomicrorhabdus indica]
MKNLTRFQYSMELNLNEVIAENNQLKETLSATQKELSVLKSQYAALEEDFIHALKCENKATCPKSNVPQTIRSPSTQKK